MRHRKTTDIFSWLIGGIGSDTLRKYLSVLTLIALTGTLGLIPSLHELENPWLTNSGFTSQQHYPDSLTQVKYLPSNEDELTVEGSKSLLKLVSIEGFQHSISPANAYWESLIDGEKSSPYALLFGSLPLRSPPYFS